MNAEHHLAAIPGNHPGSGTLAMLFCCSLLAWGTLLSGAETTPGRLEFLDGSMLHGRLLEIRPKEGLIWEHPDAREALQIGLGGLQVLHLDRPSQLPEHPGQPPGCRLSLVNGDEFLGDLVALGEKEIVVDTWFGGRLTAPRDAVRSLVFLREGRRLIYTGPEGPEDWVVGPTPVAWRYEDQAFHTQTIGSIGRKLDLPPAARFELELEWEGEVNLMAAFYTDSIERFDFRSNSYLLSVQPGMLVAQRVQAGRGMMHLGQVPMESLTRANRISLDVRVDIRKGRLSVWADGVPVQEWNDPNPFPGAGSGFALFSQRSGSRMTLRSLRVFAWDGLNEQDAERAVQERSGVWLVNQDEIQGDVVDIREGRVQVSHPLHRFQIPLDRVTRILFAGAARTRDPGSNPVQVHFADGGRLTLRNTEWAGDGVKGQSSLFGGIQLKPAWIRRLQFHSPSLTPEAPQEDYFPDDPFLEEKPPGTKPGEEGS